MEIQKNSRQIPSDKIYTANKKYSDILYGYLQNHSYLDTKRNIRYIPKTELKYARIAADLQLCRQTVSTRFNNLMKQHLVFYNELEKRYELVPLEANLATLLPNDTIRILCNTLQERCLTILSYLLKTYIQHKESPCQINLDIIKEQIGLNRDNRGLNNQIVTDCFQVLQQLGLIIYDKIRVRDMKSGGMKTVYVLERVNNEVIIGQQQSNYFIEKV